MLEPKVLGIIPARYASTRFPGKPLALIQGKPMIAHVYERSLQVSRINYLAVATDDERIASVVRSFGGNVIMTSPLHNSGTDRCQEVVNVLAQEGKCFDIALNIQGDEPFVMPEQLEMLIDCFANEQTDIATLIKRITDKELIENPNVVKAIIDKNHKAIYFSRFPIPYVRNAANIPVYYKHLGLYAYRTSVLKAVTELPQSSLELAESLEQLRWIENGYNIFTKTTEIENMAVDTPEDLERINLSVLNNSIKL